MRRVSTQRSAIKNAVILLLMTLTVVHAILAFSTADVAASGSHTLDQVDITLIDVYRKPSSIVPGQTVAKSVSVLNNANSQAAYVRIKLVKEWDRPANGQGIALASDLITINFTHDNDWIKIGDYYYYKKILPAGRAEPNAAMRTTSTLFESFTLSPNAGNQYANISGHITVSAEAIQASGDAITIEWDVIPGAWIPAPIVKTGESARAAWRANLGWLLIAAALTMMGIRHRIAKPVPLA